jgi:hypothetical protein
MRRTILATTLLTLAALALAPAAWAGGPGTWSQVTASGLAVTRQVSLARTADGTLHVAWAGPGYAETQILERSVSRPGVLAPATTVVLPDSTSIGDPALVADGGTPWAFYAGFFLGGQEGLAYSAYDMQYNLWHLPVPITEKGNAYLANPSAIRTADGTFFEAWDSENGVFVHRGFLPDPEPAEFNNVDLSPTGYYSNLAVETGTGRIWLAWSRIDNAHPGTDGVWVRLVDASTGAPAGAPYQLPGSTTVSNGTPGSYFMQARTPMASQPTGPGVFVAYPTGYPRPTGVRLWKLGTDAGGSPTATSVAIAAGSAVQGDAAVAADPVGRLWVLWAQRDGSRFAVYARRSNPFATVFGAPVKVFVPAGVGSLWHIAADAQADRVDVLAHVSNAAGAATWHTQLLAGLSVTFSKTALKAKTRYSLVVTVKDAGTPVAGVKVRIGTKAGKTNASGKATLKVGPLARGSVTVTVTGTGYSTMTTHLRVK